MYPKLENRLARIAGFRSGTERGGTHDLGSSYFCPWVAAGEHGMPHSHENRPTNRIGRMRASIKGTDSDRGEAWIMADRNFDMHVWSAPSVSAFRGYSEGESWPMWVEPYHPQVTIHIGCRARWASIGEVTCSGTWLAASWPTPVSAAKV